MRGLAAACSPASDEYLEWPTQVDTGRGIHRVRNAIRSHLMNTEASVAALCERRFLRLLLAPAVTDRRYSIYETASAQRPYLL